MDPVAIQRQQRQKGHQHHQALVLDYPAKCNVKTIERQDDAGEPSIWRLSTEPSRAKLGHRHHPQNADPGKGKPPPELVYRAAQTPTCHRQQNLGRSLLVQKKLNIISLYGSGGSNHDHPLISLELTVPQMRKAQSHREEKQEGQGKRNR